MLSTLTASELPRDVDAPLVRPRRAKSRWQGVRHRDLVDAIVDVARAAGWRCRYHAGHLARNGADVAASFTIEGAEHVVCPGLKPSFGVTASNAMRRGLRFYAGALVPAADSAFVVHTIRRLGWRYQTDTLDLRAVVKYALDEWYESALTLGEIRKRLTDHEISYERAALLLYRAARDGEFPWSRLGKVDAFLRRGKVASSWALLMALGRAAAMNPPEKQMDQLRAAYGIVSRTEW